MQHISSDAIDTILNPVNTVLDPSVINVQLMAEALQPHAVEILPDADENNKGVTRIATEQEVLDGTEPFAYVTPLTLQAKWIRPEASETAAGIVQFANPTNLLYTNRNSNLAIHTSGMWELMRNIPDSQSEIGRRGTVALASGADGIAGTNTTLAMTPAATVAAINQWAEGGSGLATEAIEGVVRLGIPGALDSADHNGFAVSPKAFLESNASTAKPGTIELATQAEANALIDATRAITPATIPLGTGSQAGIVRITSTPATGATNIAFSADGATKLLNTIDGGAIEGALTVNANLTTTGIFSINEWDLQANGGQLTFKHNGTTKYTINSNGTTTTASNITAYSTSDIRVKSNIEGIDSALKRIELISAQVYNQVGFDERQLGVIAQTVEIKNPELVAEFDGIKAVNYNGITALNTQAINELVNELAECKARISELEKR